jgi:hypothetical protein
MSKDKGPLRETFGQTGRVYQSHAGDSMVAIDWKPIEPILGHAVLTHGQAALHPTEGKVVYFPGVRRRRGTTTIAVRTGARPDLLQLFDLAMAMRSDLRAELSVARRKRGSPSTLALERPRSPFSVFHPGGLHAQRDAGTNGGRLRNR